VSRTGCETSSCCETSCEKRQDNSAEDLESKENAYLTARIYAERIQDRLGSLECRELLGYDVSKPEDLQRIREMGLFQTRCPGFVRASVEVLADLLEG
jgi:hypothetical protein